MNEMLSVPVVDVQPCLLVCTGNGRVKFVPWEPNKAELQLLKENKKRIKLQNNSFIGLF